MFRKVECILLFLFLSFQTLDIAEARYKLAGNAEQQLGGT